MTRTRLSPADATWASVNSRGTVTGSRYSTGCHAASRAPAARTAGDSSPGVGNNAPEAAAGPAAPRRQRRQTRQQQQQQQQQQQGEEQPQQHEDRGSLCLCHQEQQQQQHNQPEALVEELAPGVVRLVLPRPVGLVFEQKPEGGPVYVAEVVEGGAAWRTGRVQKRDILSRCSAVALKPAVPAQGEAQPEEARAEAGGDKAAKGRKGRKQQQQQQQQGQGQQVHEQEAQHSAQGGEDGGQWEVVEFDCEDRAFRSVLAAFRSHDNSWWGSRPITLVLRKPHTSPNWEEEEAAGATGLAAAVHDEPTAAVHGGDGGLHGEAGGHGTEAGRVGGRRRRGPRAVQDGSRAADGEAEGGGVPRVRRAVKRGGARRSKAGPEAGQAGEHLPAE